jgi:hypothetical protein
MSMDVGDGLDWRKATYSGGDNGGCLFVAPSASGRRSVDGVKAGEFDTR